MSNISAMKYSTSRAALPGLGGLSMLLLPVTAPTLSTILAQVNGDLRRVVPAKFEDEDVGKDEEGEVKVKAEKDSEN